MLNIDDRLYSLRDVLSALSGYESEEAWNMLAAISNSYKSHRTRNRNNVEREQDEKCTMVFPSSLRKGYPC